MSTAGVLGGGFSIAFGRVVVVVVVVVDVVVGLVFERDKP